MSRRTLVQHAALCALAACAAEAHGAGLSRPNVVGARAIGMGGAYTAIADDPTAAWYNPSGTAIYGDNVGYVGGELVFTGRSYTPDAQSVLGQAGITHKITENTAPTFIPVLGFTTRFGLGNNAPTRFAFSIATYDSYGGAISFSPASVTPVGGKPIGITSSQVRDYEVAPTLAYQVNELLSLGASLRIGVNTFSVDDTEPAFAANLSGTGVGVGATLGAMIRPHPLVQIGLVYRSPLNAAISGKSPVTIGGTTTNQDFGVHLKWPQSAGIGVAVKPYKRILVSVQADWTGWSSFQKLDLTVAGISEPKELRYMDSYAVHAGIQGTITSFLLLRLGWAWDSNAIPDRTMRRENEDANKSTIAAGFGLHLWKIFIDGAFEAFLPLAARVVSTPTPATSPENETGRYSATIYSAELSAQIRF